MGGFMKATAKDLRLNSGKLLDAVIITFVGEGFTPSLFGRGINPAPYGRIGRNDDQGRYGSIHLVYEGQSKSIGLL
jgi:hypothetical protein